VWQIEIKNEEGKLTCLSRITMAVLVPDDTQGATP
jgi:acyl-coenzyme A thioesterase PaaI-like protein